MYLGEGNGVGVKSSRKDGEVAEEREREREVVGVGHLTRSHPSRHQTCSIIIFFPILFTYGLFPIILSEQINCSDHYNKEKYYITLHRSQPKQRDRALLFDPARSNDL